VKVTSISLCRTTVGAHVTTHTEHQAPLTLKSLMEDAVVLTVLEAVGLTLFMDVKVVIPDPTVVTVVLTVATVAPMVETVAIVQTQPQPTLMWAASKMMETVTSTSVQETGVTPKQPVWLLVKATSTSLFKLEVGAHVTTPLVHHPVLIQKSLIPAVMKAMVQETVVDGLTLSTQSTMAPTVEETVATANHVSHQIT